MRDSQERFSTRTSSVSSASGRACRLPRSPGAQAWTRAISGLEAGKRGTTPETLGALADALGCDMTELMPDKVAA